MAELPSLRGPPTRPPGAAGGANAPPPQLDEKTAKTRKALIEKLALAQEVQRLVLEKRIRPLLITEVSATTRTKITAFFPFRPVVEDLRWYIRRVNRCLRVW